MPTEMTKSGTVIVRRLRRVWVLRLAARRTLRRLRAWAGRLLGLGLP